LLCLIQTNKQTTIALLEHYISIPYSYPYLSINMQNTDNITDRTKSRIERMKQRQSCKPKMNFTPGVDNQKVYPVVLSKEVQEPLENIDANEDENINFDVSKVKHKLKQQKISAMERELEYIEEMRFSLSQDDFEDWYQHHLETKYTTDSDDTDIEPEFFEDYEHSS